MNVSDRDVLKTKSRVTLLTILLLHPCVDLFDLALTLLNERYRQNPCVSGIVGDLIHRGIQLLDPPSVAEVVVCWRSEVSGKCKYQR